MKVRFPSLAVLAVVAALAGLAALAVIVLLAGASQAVAQVSPVSVTFGIESVVSDVGGEAVVAVEAKDINGGSVNTWALEVSYDPTVVEAITCAVTSKGVCVVNAGIGTVEVLNLSSPTELVKDTVLATITFRCENEGTTDLSLVNRLGGIPEELPDVETEDGVITCTEPVEATATPRGEATATPHDEATATPQPSLSLSALPSTGGGSSSDTGFAPPLLALAAVALSMLLLSIAAGHKGNTRS